MDTYTYLKRINYEGPLTPNGETLRRLQLAHLLAVPFENLSIHRGEPILLDDAMLFEKIVTRRRGGFCYELNGLFCALLWALRFDVVLLAASVRNEEGIFGPAFDHMALMVTLSEPWLVDVGFGDSFREPLRLNEREGQHQEGERYRIDTSDDQLMLMRFTSDGWTPQYRFTLTGYNHTDFFDMCHYHQTSAESHFKKGRVCSLATIDGRITLSDNRLIITRKGERIECELADEQAWTDALRDHFGIAFLK